MGKKIITKIPLLLFLFITHQNLIAEKSELFKHRKKTTEALVKERSIEELKVALGKSNESLKKNESDKIIKDCVFRFIADKTIDYEILQIFYEFSSRRQKKELLDCYSNFLEGYDLVAEVKKGKIDLLKLLLTMSQNEEETQGIITTTETNEARKYSQKKNIGPLMAVVQPHFVDSMSSGRQLLSIAAKLNHIDAVKEMIAIGFDIDHKDEWGWTPLMYAAAGGYDRMASLLVNAGARTDIQNSWGETAYTLAYDFDYQKVMALLPADSNSMVFSNSSIEAFSKNNPNIVIQLKNSGSSEITGGLVLAIFMPVIAPILLGPGGRERLQGTHLAEVLQEAFFFVGMLEKPKKAPKKSHLEKFFLKYIKSEFKTKLNMKMVAAQIALANYTDLYKSFNNCWSKTDKDLYQNSQIENKTIPYGKKGKKIKKGSYLSKLQTRLFPKGMMADLKSELVEP